MAGNPDCLFPRPSPRPGEWVKGKVIGSGSFGNVHLAMNKVTGALFVVKSAKSCAGFESLENEANILEGLNSPFIVKCMGRELRKESNGDRKISIVMEYMAGGSLSDVADNFGGSLDEEVIRLYTREILCGLKYLHENGIVHCDLKCKNVLLGSSGNVKLTDFGCARRPKDKKNNGESGRLCWQSIGGTPLWMAPEVLRNEGLDYASDIWSLGCTVIEMATGRPPWSDECSNPAAAVLKIACSNQMPRFPSLFSREGLDFLSKCLERRPKRRWTAEELLQHPFILGTSVRYSKKDGSCSPASILDIGMYDCDYDSDEAGSSNEGKSLYINPFSTRQCIRRKGMGFCRQLAESGLEQLDDHWITVRSGGQI